MGEDQHAEPYDRTDESVADRLDRNWDELLQELRVTQTGIQILTGFLLTLPVQPAFVDFSNFERAAYIGAISTAIGSTGLLVTPVAMHRAMFRKRRKDTLVNIAHRVAQLGLAALALAVACVVMLVFSLVFSQRTGLVAGLVTLAMFVAAWLVLPFVVRRRQRD